MKVKVESSTIKCIHIHIYMCWLSPPIPTPFSCRLILRNLFSVLAIRDLMDRWPELCSGASRLPCFMRPFTFLTCKRSCITSWKKIRKEKEQKKETPIIWRCYLFFFFFIFGSISQCVYILFKRRKRVSPVTHNSKDPSVMPSLPNNGLIYFHS